MRNKHFLIVIYHSSLVKAAVNAARFCKLRNGVSAGSISLDSTFNKRISQHIHCSVYVQGAAAISEKYTRIRKNNTAQLIMIRF